MLADYSHEILSSNCFFKAGTQFENVVCCLILLVLYYTGLKWQHACVIEFINPLPYGDTF